MKPAITLLILIALISAYVVRAAVKAAEMERDCFGSSKVFGDDDDDDPDMANLERLEAKFNDDMKLYSISGCKNSISSQLQNLQFTLIETSGHNQEQLQLHTVGPKDADLPLTSTCSSFILDSDEYVTLMEIRYRSNEIVFAAFLTSKGNFQRWGASNTGSLQSWSFSSENELVGIFGNAKDEAIASLGAIVFKSEECAAGLPTEIDEEEEEVDSTPISDLIRDIQDDWNKDKKPWLVGIMIGVGVILLTIILFCIVCNKTTSKKAKTAADLKFWEKKPVDLEKAGGNRT